MQHKKIKHISKPLTGDIYVPGSKSITNRALLLASLCGNTIKLKNPLLCDDTLAMISCLKELGVKITKKGDTITVKGNILNTKNRKYTLNAELSGTTLRFLLPFLCATKGEKVLGGQGPLNNRPVKHLVDSLKALGADLTYLEKEGFPPLLIKQSKLAKKTIEIKGTMSSQYVSSMLMMLPFIDTHTLKVTSKLVSKPYIDLTLKIMEEFGVSVTNKNYKIFKTKKNSSYSRSTTYKVEGDLSSACYFAALAVLTGSKVSLKNINPKSQQGDRMFFDILKQMGNTVTEKNNSIVITGTSIKPIRVHMGNCPDQVQTLAVLASFAKGKTRLSGIETLWIKETDRVTAVRTELKKMGIRTLATKKTLTIFGGNPKAAAIDTYGDHRMAMSFALAGTKIPGLVINNPTVVTKTFPDFWSNLDNFGSQP